MMRLDPRCFLGEKPVTIQLLTPAPYDTAKHQEAETKKPYNHLVVATPLTATNEMTMNIPARSPGACWSSRREERNNDKFCPCLSPKQGLSDYRQVG